MMSSTFILAVQHIARAAIVLTRTHGRRANLAVRFATAQV
jgi:hypothetical protein